MDGPSAHGRDNQRLEVRPAEGNVGRRNQHQLLPVVIEREQFAGGVEAVDNVGVIKANIEIARRVESDSIRNLPGQFDDNLALPGAAILPYLDAGDERRA